MTPELRELLELSAKAMGYAPLISKVSGDVLIATTSEQWVRWQPHQDKAQRMDLIDMLKISVEWDSTCVAASHKPVAYVYAVEHFSDHSSDAAAYTMAVLRVAAEIGRRMQG